MRYLPLLLLVSCAHPRQWDVIGGTGDQISQARTILWASFSRTQHIPNDGYVSILPVGALDDTCAPGRVAGCSYANGVEVTAAPDQDMLTTALAHELCHYDYGTDEQAANNCADLVNKDAKDQMFDRAVFK